MHCIHCGAATAAGATRCPRCGRALHHGANGDATTPIAISDGGPAGEVGELQRRLQEALGPEYVVERVLGQGGFAVVFLVRDRTLKRQLAVKVISPDLIVSKTVTERFRREAETIAQLSHANIVPVHFVGHRDDLFYLAMAFVDGESLADRLKRAGHLRRPSCSVASPSRRHRFSRAAPTYRTNWRSRLIARRSAEATTRGSLPRAARRTRPASDPARRPRVSGSLRPAIPPLPLA